MKDLSVDEDTKVTFEVRVTGKPEPEITWYKDGRLLVNSEAHKITHSKGLVTMVISRVGRFDGGKYVCVAKNPGGQAQNSALLLVKGVCGEVLSFGFFRYLKNYLLLLLLFTFLFGYK